jgi:benzoate-CoA ligase
LIHIKLSGSGGRGRRSSARRSVSGGGLIQIKPVRALWRKLCALHHYIPRRGMVSGAATSMNAAETLLSTGEGNRTALECADSSLSYSELRDAVRRAAGMWRELGLETGERVLVYASDSIDWVIAYLGVIWAGGVAVGLNSRLFEKDLSVVLSDCGARFVFSDPGEVATLQRLLRDDAGRTRIVKQDEARALWSAARAVPAERRPPESPALWFYTSGTTGLPKGVIHAQRAVLETASFAKDILGLDERARLYASSKLFFAYALGNALCAGLRLGATIILDSEWPTAERVAQVVERHHPTAMFSVPTLYLKLLQAGLHGRLARAGVRHFVSAGEALPGAVRRLWKEGTGIAPVSGYGASETIALVLYCDDDSGLLSPSPMVEIRPRAAPAEAAGTPRRVWLRHPCVSIGYWKRPQAQTDSFDEGWFSPGDLFRRAGEAWEFCGRDDDMLKISGQWVSVLEIEQTLISNAAGCVQQLAAVGYTSSDGLGSIALFAVAAAGREPEARERIEAGMAKLPKIKRPRLVKWIDEMPITATGKLQRRKLKELYLAGAFA